MNAELKKLPADELKIVVELARNMEGNDVAHKLGITRARVNSKTFRIYDRLGFRGRAALTHWAIQNKLVKLGDFEK